MGLQKIARILPKIVLVLASLFCYVSIKTLMFQPRAPPVAPTTRVFIVPPGFTVKDPQSNIAVPSETSKELKIIDNKNASASSEQCGKKWLGTPPSILNNPRRSKEDENITCAALLYGDLKDEVYTKAKNYMKKYKRTRQPSDTYFQEIIQDIGCTTFRESRGYHLNALDEEEEEYPIAYNLLIHKDIDQVEQLLRSIYRPQNSFCIHIDSKSKPDVIESVRAIANCFDNVFLASRLEHIVYAGYSRLQADINCMKDQLKSPIKWRYLLNAAGSEMPAKSNLEMVRILKIYNGANDIEGMYGTKVHRSRFENEWLEDVKIGKLNKTGKKNPKPPYDIDMVKGSAYGVFSREFTEWLINDEKPKALLEWSKKTWSPDEHYWATLHHKWNNPHLKAPGGYSGDPMKKAWLAVWVAWGGVTPCHGRWSRGTCVFGIQDLPALVTRPEFMINKFSVDQEPLAQECIARWIEYKSQCRPFLDEEFYKRLPFILKSDKS